MMDVYDSDIYALYKTNKCITRLELQALIHFSDVMYNNTRPQKPVHFIHKYPPRNPLCRYYAI